MAPALSQVMSAAGSRLQNYRFRNSTIVIIGALPRGSARMVNAETQL